MREQILNELRDGLVKVVFTKKDGTQRSLLGTLNPSLIPEEKQPKGSNRVHSVESQPVYDVEKDDWRSFRWDSLVSHSTDL